MAETLTARERAFNHEDGVNIINELKGIADSIGKYAKRKPYTVYGFRITSNESDPSEKVTYLEDAIGMTPAKMDCVNGKFDYGSWRNAFFMPRPCMVKFNGTVDYYLDPDDFTKKADGTPSDYNNTAYDGNAMIEWGQNGKKIWWKVVPDSDDPTSADFYFADEKVDSTYHAWNFINQNNQYADHFYTPAYNGSMDSNSKMRSISGQSISNAISGSAELTACKANGEGWYTEVVSDRMLITYLLWLMGKSTDLQGTYGQGLSGGGETAMKAYKTGALDKMGMFFGYSDTSHAVKVFGMENFWGCQWRRTAGLINKNGAIFYKMTRGTADGSSAADYNSDGTGYLAGPTSMPDGGWVTKYDYSTGVYIPAEVGGSDKTYYCDYYWINKAATCYALYGGSSASSSYCGSCVDLRNAFGDAWWSRGAALSLKPLA
ncbi:hypothetical protein [Stecheria intestinalis]|uniref:hypothetical protein n=1 Tax=Stecheria intestinalis TaxID=2606630 RepID=UPI0023F05CA8|nr:hypothetical protein [Stecheria intestinalis]MDD5880985.1 hypothetical protein [Stecheria intestinalis]